MDKIILLENDYVEASFISEYKMAHIIWKSLHTPSKFYREAIMSLLDYGSENKTVSFLSDARLSGATDPEDRKWFQNLIPLATEKGLNQVAVVIKKDPFKKYYMNSILKVVNRNAKYNMKIFYDYDEAFNWLISFNDFKK